MTRLSVLAWFVSCMAAAGQEIGPLLNTARGRVPAAAAAVQNRHLQDVQSIAAYWARPGVWQGGDRRNIDQTYAYLSSMERWAAGNQGLALALAGAYRQLAQIQEVYARDAAIAAYATSARLYQPWVGSRAALRGDLIWLTNRYYGLAGFAPGWAPAYWVRPVEGVDALRATAVPQAVSGPPPFVELPSGVDMPEELRSKFMEIASAVHTTHLAAQPIRESVASMGLATSMKDLIRMQSNLEFARDAILQGKFKEAEENLGIASALAKRAGKAFGQ